MIPQGVVIRNAAFSITQMIVTGGILFFLYRFLLQSVGVEKLGIWSLVLATTSLSNIANLGMSGSVVKYVARYAARGEKVVSAEVIQTASVSLAVIMGVLLVAIYFLASWFLLLVVPLESQPDAEAILPYALVSLWLNAVGGVYLSGTDGLQRTYIRSVILTSGSVFYFALAVVFVPAYGLVGLGIAQVLQSGAVLLIGFLVLRCFLKEIPTFPLRWNRALFSEMLSYGVNFQINSVCSMLVDPLTKAFLSKFGGLQMVGFYEMASRMVLQFRGLIINANKVLVPTIAHIHESNPDYIKNIYRNSYGIIIYISTPLFAVIMSFAPQISWLWIGHYEPLFVLFTVLLAIGAYFNLLAGPSYFSNLGTGDLKWNTIGHLIIAVLNILLGYSAGIFFGGEAVIVASVTSLIVGSLVMIIAFHYNKKISFRCLFPEGIVMIMLLSITATVFSLTAYFWIQESLSILIIIVVSFVLLVGVPLWLNPMRTRLLEYFLRKNIKKNVHIKVL